MSFDICDLILINTIFFLSIGTKVGDRELTKMPQWLLFCVILLN